MFQVDVDLVLSTEASETETENYADVFVAGTEDYSDVEPCTPGQKTVPVQPTEPVALADTAMVPEGLAGFTESILIDDDDETGLVTDIRSASGVAETSTVSSEPFGTATSPAAPARDPMKESITSMDIDVTARIPMKPAKVHTPK